MLAVYAMIAVARGNLYPLAGWWVTPFNLGAEKRYHYVALIPLLLASCLALSSLAERWPLRVRTRNALLVALLAGVAIGQQLSGWKLDQATSERARRRTERALNQIRGEIAAAPPGQDVRLRARTFPPVGPLVEATQFPGWTALFAIFFPDDVVEGRRVRFVSSDPAVLAAARGGRRSASLLVAAAPAPSPP